MLDVVGNVAVEKIVEADHNVEIATVANIADIAV